MSKEPEINLKLISLAWPMFIEGLTGGLVTLADTFFLSKISDEVASSVGMLGAVLWIGYWVLPSFTTAGTSVASQYIGAGRRDREIPTYFCNIIISSLCGLFLALSYFFLSGRLGLWLGMTQAQNGYASRYLEVIAVNFVLVGMRFSYAAILSARTLTQWNMVATIITNVLNIFLNWAFLTGFWFFPALGIRGIALATVISYLAGFLILFPLVHWKLRIDFFVKGIFSQMREVLLPILKIGIPSALEPLSYTFQGLIVSVLIINLGFEAMGANTYVTRLIFVDLTVSWTLTSAGQIIMSHYLGAGKTDEVHKTYWKIALYSTVFAAVNMAVYLAFHRFLFSFFTADPVIINMGFWIFMICLFMEPIRSINVLGGVALKTVGDGKFSVTVGMIFMWGLVPVMWLVTKAGFGIIGLWLCMLGDECVRAGINIWRWQKGKWKTNSVIGERPA